MERTPQGRVETEEESSGDWKAGGQSGPLEKVAVRDQLPVRSLRLVLGFGPVKDVNGLCQKPLPESKQSAPLPGSCSHKRLLEKALW
jgi:hypothetical protein